MESLGFSVYSIALSAYDSFTSSIPICTVPRTSNTMLNRSGESVHTSLFQILPEGFQLFTVEHVGLS